MMKYESLDEKSIKYIKFVCNSGLDTEFKVKASLKEICNSNMVVLSEYYEPYPYIKVPQDITLDVVCYDGLYRADTKLISFRNDEYAYTWFISMPENFTFKQERAFFRVSEEFECDYIIEADDEIRNIKARTIDISANGVSIFLPAKLVSTGDTEMNLYIDNKKLPIELNLVRVEEIAGGFKLSFKYKHIDAKDIDYISAACIKLQLKERRNMTM